MKKAFYLLLLVGLFTSCATHFGNISSSSFDRNMFYEEIATGTSKSTRYLGFGGKSKDALLFEARKEMIRKRPLVQGEQYANYAVDMKKTYGILHVETKLTLTADVVRFSSEDDSSTYADYYQKQVEKESYKAKSLNHYFYSVGDSVIIDPSGIKGTVFSIEENDKLLIALPTVDGNTQHKKFKFKHVYSMVKSKNDLKSGDSFYYLNQNLTKKKATAVAFGIKRILAKSQSGRYFIVDYDEVEKKVED